MERRELIVGGFSWCVLAAGCLGLGAEPSSISIFNRTERSQQLTVTVTNTQTGATQLSEQFEMGPDTAEQLHLDRRRGVAYDATFEVEGGERAEIGLSPSTSALEIEIEEGGQLTYQATVS